MEHIYLKLKELSSIDEKTALTYKVIYEFEQITKSLEELMKSQRRFAESLIKWCTVNPIQENPYHFRVLASDLSVLIDELEKIQNKLVSKLIQTKRHFVSMRFLSSDQIQIEKDYLMAKQKRVNIEKKSCCIDKNQKCKICYDSYELARNTELICREKLINKIVDNHVTRLTRFKIAMKQICQSYKNVFNHANQAINKFQSQIDTLIPDVTGTIEHFLKHISSVKQCDDTEHYYNDLIEKEKHFENTFLCKLHSRDVRCSLENDQHVKVNEQSAKSNVSRCNCKNKYTCNYIV